MGLNLLRDEHDLAILKMKNSVIKIKISGIRVSEDHEGRIVLGKICVS